MPVERETGSWLELPELQAVSPSHPLVMRGEWIPEFGPLDCRRCGREIEPGEEFWLAGACAMGGVIPAAQFHLYADLLEPHAEHAGCRKSVND